MDIEKAIQVCPEYIELRLAISVLYEITLWDIAQMMKELWRRN